MANGALGKLVVPIGILVFAAAAIWAYERDLHESVLGMAEDEFARRVSEWIQKNPIQILQLFVVSGILIQTFQVRIPASRVGDPLFEIHRYAVGLLTAITILLLYIWLELAGVSSE